MEINRLFRVFQMLQFCEVEAFDGLGFNTRVGKVRKPRLDVEFVPSRSRVYHEKEKKTTKKNRERKKQIQVQLLDCDVASNYLNQVTWLVLAPSRVMSTKFQLKWLCRINGSSSRLSLLCECFWHQTPKFWE